MKTMRWSALLLVVAAAACSSNPYTGRKQLMLLDRESELALGSQAYQEALASEPRLTRDPQYFTVVDRVAKRLSSEMEKGWGDIKPPKYSW